MTGIEDRQFGRPEDKPVREGEMTLQTAKRLKPMLEEMGAKVFSGPVHQRTGNHQANRGLFGAISGSESGCTGRAAHAMGHPAILPKG